MKRQRHGASKPSQTVTGNLRKRAACASHQEMCRSGCHEPAIALARTRRSAELDRRGDRPAESLRDRSPILRADGRARYGKLNEPRRSPDPVTAAPRGAHRRRSRRRLADIAAGKRHGKGLRSISPQGLEAVTTIGPGFDIGRDAADWALRPLRLARRYWMFAGPGGRRPGPRPSTPSPPSPPGLAACIHRTITPTTAPESTD